MNPVFLGSEVCGVRFSATEDLGARLTSNSSNTSNTSITSITSVTTQFFHIQDIPNWAKSKGEKLPNWIPCSVLKVQKVFENHHVIYFTTMGEHS